MSLGGGAKYFQWLLLASALLCLGYLECCVEEEQIALLEIKTYMKSHLNPKYDEYVSPWFEIGERDNCCQWYEVSCDVSTGRVTKLDLSLKVMRSFEDQMKNPWLFNVTLFRPFSHLVSLDLTDNDINGLVEDNGSTKISTLKNLQILKLDYNYFKTNYISVSVLTSLKTLTLGGSVQESNFRFQELANLRELRILDLSQNSLTTSIQGLCELRNIQKLELQGNSIPGGIPSCLQNWSSLEILDLSDNQFSGELPSALSKLKSLNYLDLSDNLFQGKWSFNSLANHSKLQVLRLSGNMLEVHTEDSSWESTFQLQSLHLRDCNLNKPDGTIPKFLLHQYNLSEIDLSNNNLVGTFPYWLLGNNSQLRSLFLANNSLAGYLQLPQNANYSLENLDISSNNFQGKVPENIGFMLSKLVLLNMSKNHFHDHIPTSLGDMRELEYLDFSNNNFSGELPGRLFSRCTSLDTLQLQNNNLQGEMIPWEMNLPTLSWLKLSNNNLGGTIKDVLLKSSNLYYLDISNNKVTGELPQWIGNFSWLNTLSMSENDLQGPIPGEICKLQYLDSLDLSQNNFTGLVPSCANFSSLNYMHLHANRLTGTIPHGLSSYSGLKTLDLKDNQLVGGIPHWIGKLSSLTVLLLAGNSLHGQIPNHLCQLRHVNILDLSRNNLSGEIPKCFTNMSFGIKFDLQYTRQIGGSASTGGKRLSFSQYSKPDEVEFLEKNQYLSYTAGVLVLMSGLDLSCNKLTGIIPVELGELRTIHSLNLSHNHLTNSIPTSFSRLEQIESLDLSYNNLSGTIPSQLVKLNFLAVFNVSYNNLTGRVPEAGQFANFDKSNYLGNPGLYGFFDRQLHNQTTALPPDSTPTKVGEDGDDEEMHMEDFLWSFGMSCTIMFLATVAILYINPQWRQAWFDFVDWHLLKRMSISLLSMY